MTNSFFIGLLRRTELWCALFFYCQKYHIIEIKWCIYNTEAVQASVFAYGEFHRFPSYRFLSYLYCYAQEYLPTWQYLSVSYNKCVQKDDEGYAEIPSF